MVHDRIQNWLSANGTPAPARFVSISDTTTADQACRMAADGTGMVWEGDFRNARQLLDAMGRRVTDRKRRPTTSPSEAFHRHRQTRSRRARTLGMLLVPMEPGHVVPLRRAPDVSDACEEAYGPVTEPSVISLRELLGIVGAHEWRRNGVPIAALDARVHPHYGVFSPVRGEYVELVADAPLPATTLAFDIGTGTGVLAALLARRGVERIVATDKDPRAVLCARDNFRRLGYEDRIETVQTDLFPAGRASLVVCNPPWIPARPHSALDHAVYDPDSRMLRGFLDRLPQHLLPSGEGWLILSDLAEHLGLRSRDGLLAMIEQAGLRVADRSEIRPSHPKAADRTDPLHAARAAEVTSLWRLRRVT